MPVAELRDVLPELTRGVTVLPWDRRHGLYFADVELIVSTGQRTVAVAGSGVAGSVAAATERCYSEFYERWCQLGWQLAGEALTSYDLLTHEVTGTVRPSSGGRPDSTGSCAHRRQCEPEALLHGLLEVVERDAVVRLLDRHAARTVRVPVDAPAIARTAARWGVVLHCFAIVDLWSTAHAYTVLAVARGDRRGGALGSASRFRLELATEAACQQALMMYTTVTHQARQAEPPDGYADLVRTADGVDDILAELDGAGSADRLLDALPGATVSALAECARQVFGRPPAYLRYRPAGLAVGDRVSLRVMIDGALDPRCVTRTPWPVG